MSFVAQVDEGACAAHGDCAVIAPDAFRVDDDVAVVVGSAPDELLVEAAAACPSVAIRVVDEETGEQLYP